MDRSFMSSYAPASLLRRGYANSWTPLEQMWVAERAYRSGRGFGPWPNTARMCGLLADEVPRNKRGGRGLGVPRDPLSRDERAAYGGEAGFAPLQHHVICQSCRDNELSPPSDPDPWRRLGRFLGRRRDYRCELCGGYGVVAVDGLDRLDAYMLPHRGL